MTTSNIPDVSEEQLQRIVAVLKGMGHTLRFRIVLLLCESDCTVSEMVERLGVRQSAVSQHLSPLRLLGLVGVDRKGGTATYTLQEPLLRNLVDCFVSHCNH